MRAEVEARTACTASAGIGPNLLLARLATKRAKPNGQLLLGAAEARGLLAVGPWHAIVGTRHLLGDCLMIGRPPAQHSGCIWVSLQITHTPTSSSHYSELPRLHTS